jgi:hypothetical protein
LTWHIDRHVVVCPRHYEERYLSKGVKLPEFEHSEPYRCYYCVAEGPVKKAELAR